MVPLDIVRPALGHYGTDGIVLCAAPALLALPGYAKGESASAYVEKSRQRSPPRCLRVSRRGRLRHLPSSARYPCRWACRPPPQDRPRSETVVGARP
jgi:hypothetical protein